ncbi:MAG TPA: VOC family protein [Acidobacteriaceae bacterium]
MNIQGSTIIPSLRYKDAHAAIGWLVRVFGFTKQAVYDGPNGTVAHAQLTYGGGMLMLGSALNGGAFAKLSIGLDETGGRETVGLSLIVSDEECAAMFARVKAAGVEIVQEFTSPAHGGKAFGCRDLEGHIWWVGSYNPWAEFKDPAAEGTA